METTNVLADGKRLPIARGKVVLPLRVNSVSIAWKRRADAEPLSYDRAVSQYKTDYAARYQRFLQTGQQ